MYGIRKDVMKKKKVIRMGGKGKWRREQRAEEERREVGIPVVDENLLLVTQGLQ